MLLSSPAREAPVSTKSTRGKTGYQWSRAVPAAAGLRRPTGWTSYWNRRAYAANFTASRSLLMVLRSTSTNARSSHRCWLSMTV